MTAVPADEVTLIVCGAPLASRTADLVEALRADGWRPTVIGTRASSEWMDADAVAAVAGEPARFDFRQPGQPKRGGRPAAVVVCPATFNTVNKAAAGINDSYPMGVLCEALGTGTPTVVVPMVNDKLWGHPAWSRSLTVLADAGVVLVDVHTGSVGATAVASGTGDAVVARFSPLWLVSRLRAVRGFDRQR